MTEEYLIQLKKARRMLDEEGFQSLKRHAAVGRMCGCGDCFCCAALEVSRDKLRREKEAS